MCAVTEWAIAVFAIIMAVSVLAMVALAAYVLLGPR